MMKRKSLAASFVVFLLGAAFMAGGCVQGEDEELLVASVAHPIATAAAATIGVEACTYCHGRQTDEWLTGQHGNAHSAPWLPQPADPLDAPGFPDYGYFYSGNTLSTAGGRYCAECHDQLGDGLFLTEGVTGNVPRPVIGCESCHGGGAEHFGAGEIPYPKPGAEQCGQCHNGTFDHYTHHPNGDTITEEYLTSPHSRSINDHVYEDEEEGTVRSRCSRCHTNEGYKMYVKLLPGTAGHDEIVDFFEGDPNSDLDDIPPIEDATNVGCGTCHDAHRVTGDNLEILDGDTDSNGNPESGQFNTCTGCHQLVREDGTALLLPGGTPDTYHALRYGTTAIAYSRNIADTHVAAGSSADKRYNWFVGIDSSSGRAVNKPIQPLIFVDKSDPHACAKCHNPHEADAAPNEQWSQSGHGDAIGDPWIHYNWKEMTGGWSGTGRQDCQRCHTATGFMNFANTLAADTVGVADTLYDPANNDFSYLAPDPALGSGDSLGRSESLYCWACHAAIIEHDGNTTEPNEVDIEHAVKFRGQYRNPVTNYNRTLSLSLLYGNTPFSGDTVITGSLSHLTFGGNNVPTPDPSASNMCLTCHSGRENGAAIMDPGINWGETNSVVNSHYLPAGGVLYRQNGYEYLNEGYGHETHYANAAYFAHDAIGTPEAGSTVAAVAGLNGPCVGCHMHANPEKHLFSPVEHDGSTVTLVSTACYECHDAHGHPLTGADIGVEKEEYNSSLEALEGQLSANGFHFLGSYPYFQEGDWTLTSGGTTMAGTTSEARYGQNNMGAAFNFNMLHHEPGAFAHNRFYAKRLIYDSIDWLDNNAMDESVGAAILALESAGDLTALQRQEACEYLLGDDTCATGGRP